MVEGQCQSKVFFVLAHSQCLLAALSLSFIIPVNERAYIF